MIPRGSARFLLACRGSPARLIACRVRKAISSRKGQSTHSKERVQIRFPPILVKQTIKEALLYQPLADSRVRCTACARYCNIPEGKVGLCGVRQNIGGKLQLLVYGKVITGHIDPIEKKPVVHYMPGSKIFSIATTGCNWLCSYCFTPETVIVTDKGVRTIKSIFDDGINEESNGLSSTRDLGELRALTHKGRFKQIKKAFRHFFDGNVLRVKPWYLPEFRCTPDHKVFATSDPEHPPIKLQARFLTKKNFLVIPKFKEQAMPKSIDLTKFLSQIVLPKYKLARGSTSRLQPFTLRTIVELTSKGWTSRRIGKHIDLHPATVRRARSTLSRSTIEEFASHYRPYRVKSSKGRVRLSHAKHDLPRFLILDDSFAKLCGYYCADGSVSKSSNRPNSYTVGFTFGREEASNIEDVKELVKRIFGLSCTIAPQGSAVQLFF